MSGLALMLMLICSRYKVICCRIIVQYRYCIESL